MSLGRILHLEGDPQWAEIVKRGLIDKYDYFHAASQKEAANLILKMIEDGHKFDVAVIDISLVVSDASDKQGLEFIKMLEKHGVMLGHSIIVLSGYVDVDQNWRVAFNNFNIADVIDKANFVEEREEFYRLIDEIVEML